MKKLISILMLFISLNVFAQNTTLDNKQIDNLTNADRAQIEDILRKNRLITPDQNFRSNDDLRGFLGLPDIKIEDPRRAICKAACDVSAAAAVTACGGLSGGVAIAACTVAAAVALDSCKKGC